MKKIEKLHLEWSGRSLLSMLELVNGHNRENLLAEPTKRPSMSQE